MKMNRQDYTNISPGIDALTKRLEENSYIDPELYSTYDVKRGLRDINGRGVLAGLTNIADVYAYEEVDGKSVPCPGKLFYRGYNMEDLVSDFVQNNRYGFEETTYLLLTGDLPSKKNLAIFEEELAAHRFLPDGFVRDIIMESPSNDVMNAIARSVLTLYTYDQHADDMALDNLMRQSLQLIASFPSLAAYSYQAFNHYHNGNSMFLHNPPTNLSQAETLLYLIRPDKKYTELEARTLDLCFVVHADHGGGNNSTFTTRVVSSTGTDTYSAVAAALCSLKGPKHGGANIKVRKMFEDMKATVKDWKDDDEIAYYINNLLDKKAFDNSGLVYGMGHAVYSISDPRATVLRDFVRKLSDSKGRTDECTLYEKTEALASDIISKRRKIYKGVSANVDFYSGFVYDMLDLPPELYTPIFAVSRISGWCAHRLEEIYSQNKIIRPAYKNVAPQLPYIPLNDR